MSEEGSPEVKPKGREEQPGAHAVMERLEQARVACRALLEESGLGKFPSEAASQVAQLLGGLLP